MLRKNELGRHPLKILIAPRLFNNHVKIDTQPTLVTTSRTNTLNLKFHRKPFRYAARAHRSAKTTVLILG